MLISIVNNRIERRPSQLLAECVIKMSKLITKYRLDKNGEIRQPHFTLMCKLLLAIVVVMNISRYPPQDEFHFYYNWKADVDQNTLPIPEDNKELFKN